MSLLSAAWGAVKSAGDAAGGFVTGALDAAGGFVAEFTLGPLKLADALVSGRRIDKALVDRLNAAVRTTKDLAPYAQLVVSMVPGIGTGVSGAIGAGLALAQGKPIDQALLAGIRGAVPGGAVGQALFDAGTAAIEGKSLSDVALSAVPGLTPDERKAIGAALEVAKDISEGKNVEQSVVEHVSDAVPAKYQQATTIAMGVAMGKKLQAKQVVGLAVSTVNATGALDQAKSVVRDAMSGDPAAVNIVRGTVSAAQHGFEYAGRAVSVLRTAATAAGVDVEHLDVSQSHAAAVAASVAAAIAAPTSHASSTAASMAASAAAAQASAAAAVSAYAAGRAAARTKLLDTLHAAQSAQKAFSAGANRASLAATASAESYAIAMAKAHNASAADLQKLEAKLAKLQQDLATYDRTQRERANALAAAVKAAQAKLDVFDAETNNASAELKAKLKTAADAAETARVNAAKSLAATEAQVSAQAAVAKPPAQQAAQNADVSEKVAATAAQDALTQGTGWAVAPDGTTASAQQAAELLANGGWIVNRGAVERVGA